MGREIKFKCKICGEITLDYHFEDGDGMMSIPVSLCPTIKDVAKYYKDLVGNSYFEETGNKIEKSFKKRMITPSHSSLDDTQEEVRLHTSVNEIECWCEDY